MLPVTVITYNANHNDNVAIFITYNANHNDVVVTVCSA